VAEVKFYEHEECQIPPWITFHIKMQFLMLAIVFLLIVPLGVAESTSPSCHLDFK